MTGAFARIEGSLLRLVALTLLALAAMTWLTGGRFLTAANIESMAFQCPELALLSLAMMLSMLSGGIDLSIVSVANLSAVVAALVMHHGAGGAATGGTMVALVGILTAVACGLVCGSINGALIALAGVPPILATLGTMQLFTGLALVLTGGRAIANLPDLLQWAGNGSALGLPMPLWLAAGGAAIVGVLANRAVFGIELRLVGSNRLAAAFSGIRVGSVLIRSYVLTAVIASLTGMLMAGHANSAKVDFGSSYLLQAILVVVLGGVSPTGGFGRVLGVGIAVIALQVFSSGFGMLHFTSFAQQLAWGAFLLCVMIINRVVDRRRE